MASIDPGQMSSGWKAGVGRSGQKWLDKIQGMTENPAQKAIAQRSVWSANTAAAEQKWVNSLQGVSLDYIKSQARTAGASKYQSGASKGESKYTAFANQFAPFLSSVVASLPPRGDDAANEQRMIQNKNKIKQFSLQRRSL